LGAVLISIAEASNNEESSMSSIDAARFRVAESGRFSLADWATKTQRLYDDKKHYRKLREKNVDQLIDLQERLYAEDRWSLLLVFQGMDTAGKDGAIRHALRGVNPAGFQVASFKKPSTEELDHDYLWRYMKRVPERGRIGIFNRSYYEEVLVVRVHSSILHSQRLPDSLIDENTIWQQRYDQINNWEQHLSSNGTRVVKFFLHLSKDEQKARFRARIEDESKNWKFTDADIRERGYWDDYQEAYGAAIDATSTDIAPWYVIPADDKRNARLFVGQVIIDELSKLKPRFPSPPADHARMLAEAARSLDAE
jgi:PPK2 family polyphosphate:nucleotide phosphotransferase